METLVIFFFINLDVFSFLFVPKKMQQEISQTPLYYCCIKNVKTKELRLIGVWKSHIEAARRLVGKNVNRPVNLYSTHSKIKKHAISQWKYDDFRFDPRTDILVWKRTTGGFMPGASIDLEEEWTPRRMRSEIRKRKD